MTKHETTRDRSDRRRFLAATGAIGAAGLAGCLGLLGSDDGDDDPQIGQIGSGREGYDPDGGTPMSELPDLEGELEVYSGRGEFLVGSLLEYIEDQYDDFDIVPDPRYGDGTDLVNAIIQEGEGTTADVFYTVDAGGLGALAEAGRTRELSDDVLDMVPAEFRTDEWVGTSGRARTVPYNTDAYDESDVPDDIAAFPDFDGTLGWAPSYASCQGFVTAMRILEGDDATREWLEGVVDAGIEDYPNELAVAEAVADGEIDAGFTNHYYIQRVLDGSPDAPLATAFTSGDAGAIFDVAGAAVIDSTDSPDLAENFVRHLLSAEAQRYFAETTFEYPLIPEFDPVGDLPTIDELDVPELDLTELSDLEETIDLMREVGIDT